VFSAIFTPVKTLRDLQAYRVPLQASDMRLTESTLFLRGRTRVRRKIFGRMYSLAGMFLSKNLIIFVLINFIISSQTSRSPYPC
jgi:hypothetical protein